MHTTNATYRVDLYIEGQKWRGKSIGFPLQRKHYEDYDYSLEAVLREAYRTLNNAEGEALVVVEKFDHYYGEHGLVPRDLIHYGVFKNDDAGFKKLERLIEREIRIADAARLEQLNQHFANIASARKEVK